jgi:hypothetical protein
VKLSVRVRRGALAFAPLAAALLPGAGSASAQTVTTLVLDYQGEMAQGPRVARKGRPLLTLSARAPRSVRLEATVDPRAANQAAASSRYPLTTGQLLSGFDERPGTYCTPIISRFGGWAGPCLLDEDGDGRFESISKAGFHSATALQILFTASGGATGVDFDPPQPLPQPIAYSEMDYSTGARVAVRLRWRSNHRQARPGPVTVAMWFDASADGTGVGVISPSTRFTFRGQPVTVQLGAVTLRVLGFQSSGAMDYEMVSVTHAARVPFVFRRAANIIIM